jgi:hypothetical protein
MAWLVAGVLADGGVEAAPLPQAVTRRARTRVIAKRPVRSLRRLTVEGLILSRFRDLLILRATLLIILISRFSL